MVDFRARIGEGEEGRDLAFRENDMETYIRMSWVEAVSDTGEIFTNLEPGLTPLSYFHCLTQLFYKYRSTLFFT
jgi:hypothetical protein